MPPTCGNGAIVGVEGSELRLAGQRYVIAGVNLWQAAHWGASGSTGSRPRLLRELDKLKSIGVNTVRIMAASEAGDAASEAEAARGIPVGRMWPPMRVSPTEYNEDIPAGLDFALAQLAARGMKAILCLGNMWQWSGGFASLLHWATGSSIPHMTPAESTDAQWQAHQEYAVRFYGSDEAVGRYLDHARMLAGRINRETGVPYNREPAILAWELANEPRPLNQV
jgi:mannan endo-1,4-beta-mannosidase